MEQWLLNLIDDFGYLGIFIATLIESTFVPIPAELTVVPAGMLAAKGELSYWATLASATMGVIAGSLINYLIGLKLGRAFIHKYGPYVLIKPDFLHKTEHFFARYGRLAVFIGRLLPGIKHYIAFVAGVASMRFQPFLIFTSMGGLIWIWILLQVGYMAGLRPEDSDASVSTLETVMVATLIFSGLLWLILRRFLRH